MPLRFERRDSKSGASGTDDALLSLSVVLPEEDLTADRRARCVLVSARDDLLAAGELAVALAVAEAERDLPEGSLSLLLAIAGPGAALALARRQALPERVAALGIDLAAFPPGEAGTTMAAGLVSLAAAARRVPSFLVGSPETREAAPELAAFTYRLVDA